MSDLQTHCPHPKCGAEKPYEKFACRPHWFSLPTDIQQDISRGWKYDRKLWAQARERALEYWQERIRMAEKKAEIKAQAGSQLGLFS